VGRVPSYLVAHDLFIQITAGEKYPASFLLTSSRKNLENNLDEAIITFY
jgi:hypothetical protein